jgi:hypothetical protein
VSSTIKGVVIEEMLHMTIAANVLNAVGGHPAIDRPDFVPNYPEDLPALNLTVGACKSIQWCSCRARERGLQART